MWKEHEEKRRGEVKSHLGDEEEDNCLSLEDKILMCRKT